MKIPEKYQIWIEACKRHKLSDAQIQMARELGMNPNKLGKIGNHQQEQWKAPLAAFIEHCYFKSFKKEKPNEVISIEELAKRTFKKKLEREQNKEIVSL